MTNAVPRPARGLTPRLFCRLYEFSADAMFCLSRVSVVVADELPPPNRPICAAFFLRNQYGTTAAATYIMFLLIRPPTTLFGALLMFQSP
jgi:hypothetical protein